MTTFADIQKFDVGEVVQLFDLDTVPIGGSEVYRFTPSSYTTEAIRWRGFTYMPIDVQATGFQWSTTGALPTPTLTVSGATTAVPGIMATLSAVLIAYDNLRGAYVTRWRTLKKYLDNAATSDVVQYLQADIYVVNKKSAHNRFMIEWELCSVVDFQGQKLPRRQVLKDFCTHVYRVYNSYRSATEGRDVFDYNPSGRGTTCPWTAMTGGPAFTNYYTADGTVTTVANDVCGKRTSDCILRFGVDGRLPTTAFPSVSDTRVRQ
jgi:lambda family phage minor tail protein L